MQTAHARRGRVCSGSRSPRSRSRAPSALRQVATATGTGTGITATDHGKHKKDVKLQLLGINDFHGNLEPPTGSSARVDAAASARRPDAGGVEYLATHVRALERGVKNSLVVAAGDLIGASPLISGLFHDEPTIEAMNKIGLDITSVGNHEFDEGEQELLRMQYGGCGPDDSLPRPATASRARTSTSSRPTSSARTTAGRCSPPYTIQQGRRRQGRLHRHDARGHAADRLPVGHLQPALPRRGRHGQPLRAASCAASTTSRRSSSCCTRAARRTRRAPRSTSASASPARSSTSSTARPTTSTCSSPATRTSRTTA